MSIFKPVGRSSSPATGGLARRGSRSTASACLAGSGTPAPIWDWLPPPVDDDDEARAYVICGPGSVKGTPLNGQEYVGYPVMLSGQEYEAVPWPVLWERIGDALAGHLRRT